MAIVILNWNGWPDVLECLESVLRLDYHEFQVVVCDNGSTDGSTERIRDWARGRLDIVPERSEMASYVRPAVDKPVSLEILTRSEAETVARGARHQASVILIENGANIGFAAGNNVGLQYGLDRGYSLLWLLNPDTVVEPGSLRAMVERMSSDTTIGMCGSILRYYEAPEVIQEAGGCAYYPAVGIARRVMKEKTYDESIDWRRAESRLDYISGASCLLNRRFLEDIGLMGEDYFLYGEEIDWAYRARQKYELAVAPNSTVYHKKGRSIGSKSWGSSRSATATYYLWRARSRIARRYHSATLPIVTGIGLVLAAGEAALGHRRTASAIFHGILDRQFD